MSQGRAHARGARMPQYAVNIIEMFKEIVHVNKITVLNQQGNGSKSARERLHINKDILFK